MFGIRYSANLWEYMYVFLSSAYYLYPENLHCGAFHKLRFASFSLKIIQYFFEILYLACYLIRPEKPTNYPLNPQVVPFHKRNHKARPHLLKLEVNHYIITGQRRGRFEVSSFWLNESDEDERLDEFSSAVTDSFKTTITLE
jgi:hypothetical protein